MPCSYLFHYICQDRIIYLCITDDVSTGDTAVAQGNRGILVSMWQFLVGAALGCISPSFELSLELRSELWDGLGWEGPSTPSHDLAVLWVVSFGVQLLALPRCNAGAGGAEPIPAASGACLDSGSAEGEPPLSAGLPSLCHPQPGSAALAAPCS